MAQPNVHLIYDMSMGRATYSLGHRADGYYVKVTATPSLFHAVKKIIQTCDKGNDKTFNYNSTDPVEFISYGHSNCHDIEIEVVFSYKTTPTTTVTIKGGARGDYFPGRYGCSVNPTKMVYDDVARGTTIEFTMEAFVAPGWEFVKWEAGSYYSSYVSFADPNALRTTVRFTVPTASSCTQEIWARFRLRPGLRLTLRVGMDRVGPDGEFIPTGTRTYVDNHLENTHTLSPEGTSYVVIESADYNIFDVSIIPGLGWRFVKWVPSAVSSLISSVVIEDDTSPSTKVTVSAQDVQTSESGSMNLRAQLEWVGFNLDVKTEIDGAGTVEVVRRQYDAWVDRIVVGPAAHLTFTGLEGQPSTSGSEKNYTPSLDVQLIAHDGVGSFLRWSDGGAQTHYYTVGSANETLIAYFTGNILYGAAGNILHGSDGSIIYQG